MVTSTPYQNACYRPRMSHILGLCLLPTTGFHVRPGRPHHHTVTNLMKIDISQPMVAYMRRKTTAEVSMLLKMAFRFAIPRILTLDEEGVRCKYAMVRRRSGYHVRAIYSPLNPTLYRKIGVCRDNYFSSPEPKAHR